MLYPTRYLKSKGLGKACALITDGRFSGGTLGPVHRPRLARSGRGRGDRPGRGGRPIEIDIPNRTIHLAVADEELARRREAKGPGEWKPANRAAQGLGRAAGLRGDDHQRRAGRGARRQPDPGPPLMRVAAGLALLLAACSPSASDAPAGDVIDCALGGAAGFSHDCSVERSEQNGDPVLIVHHPDGGFRRFTVLDDGESLTAADGARRWRSSATASASTSASTATVTVFRRRC